MRDGVTTTLRTTVISAAGRAGFSLLTLDTKRGDGAEHLYRQGGWIPAGTVPGYALDPDGTTPHDAVIFYKALDQTSGDRGGTEGST